uniref:Cystatin-B n=1 Tax=Sander lucioperca TaxID=283035 RepID=A0A8D0DGA6_SANLU
MATTIRAYGETVPTNMEIREICDKMRPQVEDTTGKKYVKFIPVQYRRLDGGDGISYLIKVHVAEKAYIHVEIFQDLKEKVSLINVKEHQTKDSLIMFGEYSLPPEPATEEIQEMCDQVKPQVEKNTGNKYVEFIANEYRRQDDVDGINYLIKVHVGGEDDYIHLDVFRNLGGKVSLTNVQAHQTIHSPLEPF